MISYTITVEDHNFARIEPVSAEVHQLLSCEQRVYRGKRFGWKTLTHELCGVGGEFYTGLVDYVLENLKDVTVIDSRNWPPYSFISPELSIKLRSYQIDYLIDALKRRRCIVECDTGSGKTAMMAAFLATLNLPTLILVPSITLLEQLSTELTTLIPGSKFGVAFGGKTELAKWTIGLPATLSKLPTRDLQQFPLLLMDECHTAAGQRSIDVILGTNAALRFGFTGTASGRSDNRDLVVQGLFGPPIKLIETQELTEKGYLAPIRIEIVRGWFEGQFAKLEDCLIVNNEKRNQLIVDIVARNKGTILVLVKRVEHGHILQRMIPKSVFVWGETEGAERELIRKQVQEGKWRVLIASNVFAMGLDIPNLEVGINAAGGKAEILTKQRFGRISRPWHEVVKKWIDIWDDYQETLESHSAERLKYYRGKSQYIEYVGFPPGKQKRLENGWEDDRAKSDVNME